MWRSVDVRREDFDVAVEWQALRARFGGAAGAIVAFCGLVRDREVRDRESSSGDRSDISSLTLEHYPGMTESSIGAILDRAAERWPLDAIRIVHRVGELSPSDQIVLVLTASAHRAAAFAACEFVMDYLKTDAVFWKREVSDGVARWIESTAEDRRRQADWSDSDSHSHSHSESESDSDSGA